MNQEAHFFGRVAAEGAFAAVLADRGRHADNSNIAIINPEDFLHQLAAAFFAETNCTREHVYLILAKSSGIPRAYPI